MLKTSNGMHSQIVQEAEVEATVTALLQQGMQVVKRQPLGNGRVKIYARSVSNPTGRADIQWKEST
jgi:hypothetical protein